MAEMVSIRRCPKCGSTRLSEMDGDGYAYCLDHFGSVFVSTSLPLVNDKHRLDEDAPVRIGTCIDCGRPLAAHGSKKPPTRCVPCWRNWQRSDEGREAAARQGAGRPKQGTAA